MHKLEKKRGKTLTNNLSQKLIIRLLAEMYVAATKLSIGVEPFVQAKAKRNWVSFDVPHDFRISPTSSSKNVTFEQVEIRHYEVVLGDHPECIKGPPLSIGWHYSFPKIYLLDDFEMLRKKERRKESALVMSPRKRELRLRLHWGYGREELRQHTDYLHSREFFRTSSSIRSFQQSTTKEIPSVVVLATK